MNKQVSQPAIQSSKSSTTGSKTMVDVVDPFDETKHYQIEQSTQSGSEYGHISTFSGVGAPGVVSSHPIQSGPVSSYPVSSGSSVISSAPRVMAPQTGSRVVRDNLQSTIQSRPVTANTSATNRKIVQGKGSSNFASNRDISKTSYGPAEVRDGYTVKKYDSDRNKK